MLIGKKIVFKTRCPRQSYKERNTKIAEIKINIKWSPYATNNLNSRTVEQPENIIPKKVTKNEKKYNEKKNNNYNKMVKSTTTTTTTTTKQPQQ